VGFSSDTGCGLKATSTPGKSSCSIVVTPGHYPPRKADVLANYNGDGAHSASSGSASVRVKTPTCTVKLLSKRVSPQAKRLNLRVTCKVDAKLTITVRATPAGQKQIKFAHIKTTAKANKHTTIHAVFYSSGKHLLRTAKKGLRLTLKVTVVATPRTKTETVHLTSKGVKVT
jgi:hypothetical protein